MKRRSWLVLLVLGYALLRWVMLLNPGYVADMNAYKRWALRASQEGIGRVYATSDMDYPPLYAWILAPVGTVYGWIEPRATQVWTNPEASIAVAGSKFLNLLIKLPPLLFDLGIGWLLFRLGRYADAQRRGASSGTGREAQAPGSANRSGSPPGNARRGASLPGRRRLPWSFILPAAYLLNPVVIIDVAYWGQADSIHSFFVLAAFLSLGFPELLRITVPGRRPNAPANAGMDVTGSLVTCSVDLDGVTGRPDGVHGISSGSDFQSTRGPGMGWIAQLFAGPGGAPRSAWLAWALLALATCMKPLGAPFFPLLLLLTFAWCGWRGVVTGVLAAVAVCLAVFAPFLVSGQMATVFKRVVGDVSLMPFTSSNAHNFWWAVGGWKPADNPVLGPFSLTHIGLAAFGTAYLWLLLAAWRARPATLGRLPGATGLLLALGIAFSFFMLSTHLHENHLFFAIPLALAIVPFDRPGERSFAILAGALTVGVFLNLALHDLVIPERFPFTLGGPTSVMNLHLKRPFFAGELAAIRFSVFWNLALYAAFLWAALRGRGLFARLAFMGAAGHRGLPPSAGHSRPPARRGSY